MSKALTFVEIPPGSPPRAGDRHERRAIFGACQLNRDLRLERTSQGDSGGLRPPTGGETGRTNFELTVLFGHWVHADGSGVGFDSSTGFTLPMAPNVPPISPGSNAHAGRR